MHIFVNNMRNNLERDREISKLTYEPLHVPVLCVEHGVEHGGHNDDGHVEVAAPSRFVRFDKPKQKYIIYNFD